MNDFITKLVFPFAHLPNWSRLLSFFTRIFTVINDDLKRLLHAFFPFTADTFSLCKHADALKIPRFSFDSDDDFKTRVSFASDFISKLGTRSQLVAVLNKLFGTRYTLAEYPKDSAVIGYSVLGRCFLGTHETIVIKVAELQDEEKKSLQEYLAFALDPDIYFIILQGEIHD